MCLSVCISGHGAMELTSLISGASRRDASYGFTVPEGVEITFYAPLGVLIENAAGNAIEAVAKGGGAAFDPSGFFIAAEGGSRAKDLSDYPVAFPRTCAAGALVPNFVVRRLGEGLVADGPGGAAAGAPAAAAAAAEGGGGGQAAHVYQPPEKVPQPLNTIVAFLMDKAAANQKAGGGCATLQIHIAFCLRMDRQYRKAFDVDDDVAGFRLYKK
ncbi:MAG: putative adhesin [Pseudomonadota bacterium]